MIAENYLDCGQIVMHKFLHQICDTNFRVAECLLPALETLPVRPEQAA